MYINLLSTDVLEQLFGFFSSEENATINTQVCRLWSALASKVAKQNLFAEYVEGRVQPGQSLADCCPDYATLKRQDLTAHTFSQVKDSIDELIEKQRVWFDTFVSPKNGFSITHARIKDIVDKSFARLCVLDKHTDWMYSGRATIFT